MSCCSILVLLPNPQTQLHPHWHPGNVPPTSLPWEPSSLLAAHQKDEAPDLPVSPASSSPVVILPFSFLLLSNHLLFFSIPSPFSGSRFLDFTLEVV